MSRKYFPKCNKGCSASEALLRVPPSGHSSQAPTVLPLPASKSGIHQCSDDRNCSKSLSVCNAVLPVYVSLCDRQSFDDESTVAGSNAAVAVTSCSPPQATPHQLQFSSQLSSDSTRLMKPLADRLRRLSTGSMHIEVGTGSSSPTRPTPCVDTDSLLSLSTSTTCLRKCMNSLTSFFRNQPLYVFLSIQISYCGLRVQGGLRSIAICLSSRIVQNHMSKFLEIFYVLPVIEALFW